ncbi:universal stress protein [Halovenus halobia]|uniref:universal stress protein n=1 Tax=Halovenus halobia TaxID=3396622 RepID=UPI003F55DC24
MTPEIDLVLSAADNTQEAAEAAACAAEVAARYDADLHLLHVIDQRIVRGLETGDLPSEVVADRQQWITGHARQHLPEDGSVTLTQSGAIGFSKDRLDQTPGSVILTVADNLEADFLVVPRVTAHGSPDEVLGKAALHVLEYAEQPVLSV